MRGLSNKNPGNIRISKVKYLGEITPSKDKAFKQFETMAYGYRAMFVLLDSYRRNGYKTIKQMINRYAPPVENHTANYINFVVDKVLALEDVEPTTNREQSQAGLSYAEVRRRKSEAQLDTQDPAEMIPIVSAMSQMENGVPANYEDVRQGWELFVKHKP